VRGGQDGQAGDGQRDEQFFHGRSFNFCPRENNFSRGRFLVERPEWKCDSLNRLIVKWVKPIQRFNHLTIRQIKNLHSTNQEMKALH
jgi:hypothetical protein